MYGQLRFITLYSFMDGDCSNDVDEDDDNDMACADDINIIQ